MTRPPSIRPVRTMQGLGLVEIMLVIAAVMVATVAVVATYRVVETNRKVQLQSEYTQGISGKIASVAISSGLGSMTQARAIQSGVYPAAMLEADGSVRNVWGGDVSIMPATGFEGAVLIMEGIPDNACIKFTQQSAASFSSVSVGSTLVSEEYGELDMDALVNACESQSGSTIRFTYLTK